VHNCLCATLRNGLADAGARPLRLTGDDEAGEAGHVSVVE
jgi:hypothetical protein